jgi:hypothetical protein
MLASRMQHSYIDKLSKNMWPSKIRGWLTGKEMHHAVFELSCACTLINQSTTPSQMWLMHANANSRSDHTFGSGSPSYLDILVCPSGSHLGLL